MPSEWRGVERAQMGVESEEFIGVKKRGQKARERERKEAEKKCGERERRVNP